MTGTTTAVRIGWIGTGVMGQSMCGHLLAAGHPTTVYSRTRAKAEQLIAAGAAWADSPAAVAASSDVVFTMVGFPQDVRDVYFSEHGVLAGAKAGTLFVDMTTTEPTLAREIQEFVKVQLAAHEYPRFVQFVDTLPMTATGKVLRRELRALG